MVLPGEEEVTVREDEVPKWQKAFTFAITFVAYVCMYISRKTWSVGKTAIINCTHTAEEDGNCSSFIDVINGKSEFQAKSISSVLDTTFLTSYATFLFLCGMAAERADLRRFLSTGLILSGLASIAFGLAKYLGIRSISWFVVVQFLGGAFQATAWPSIMAIMSNWFGKKRRGAVFGFWNSSISMGNVVGSLLAGYFVEIDWALSFIVPGLVTSAFGIIIWLFMMPHPGAVPGIFCDQSSENQREDEHHQVAISKKPEFGFPEKSSFIKRKLREADAFFNDDRAIGFCDALKIPGVLEFAFALFFVKMVAVTFHTWLPYFIMEAGISVSPTSAAFMSTLFDLGGILGGVCAGLASDISGRSASICAIMLGSAIPTLFAYQWFGQAYPLDSSTHNFAFYGNATILFFLGLLTNGPYTHINAAVSVDLGTHPSLKGSIKALSTVCAIIDGHGGAGAALSPFLAGAIPGISNTFYMLMASDLIALILLSRVIRHEWKR